MLRGFDHVVRIEFELYPCEGNAHLMDLRGDSMTLSISLARDAKSRTDSETFYKRQSRNGVFNTMTSVTMMIIA